MGCVAYDMTAREMVMVTLRWIEMPEAVIMLEVMHERMKIVLVGPGTSDELQINFSLRKCT